jgi:ABC-type lipoprotein release transport system permease subunit
MNMLGLASRNVFRHKRRAALNSVAIGLGVALMLVCLGWVQGYSTYFYGAVKRFQTGSAQLLRSGYQEEAERLPLDLTVPGYSRAREDLSGLPGVSGASGRIDFAARIIVPSGSVRLLGQGIDAEHERSVTTLSRMIKVGDYLDRSPGLLLGVELARKLGAAVGTTVLVSATDRYGVENRVALPLRGLFSFGYGAMDDSLAFIDLASAQSLLDLGDEATRIVLAGADERAVLAAARAWAAKASADDPSAPVEAYGWKEFAQGTVSAVRTDSGGFYFMAVILFGMIIIGILNSMSMSVRERHRELAALRAIGFRSKDVGRLVLLESVALAAIGTAAGLLVASPIAAWLGIAGIDIAGMIPKDFPVPFGEIYHADYRPWQFALSAAVGLGACLAGSLIPARRAARLPIAETIGAGV